MYENITVSDVKKALEGTHTEKIIAQFSKISSPPPPYEILLVNALILQGAAGVQDNIPAVGTIPNPMPQAHDRLKLVIPTMGGSALNMGGVVVAETSVGKEVGNLPHKAAKAMDMFLASGGSAEGLMDEMENIPNGILFLSELEAVLDKSNYRHKIVEMITGQWNKGFFKETLSKRGSKQNRESNFSFPSWIGNIQPARWKATVKTAFKDNGFLSRCLLVLTEEKSAQRACPSNELIDFKPIVEELKWYKNLRGEVEIPSGYCQKMRDEIADVGEASNLRLVNEYVPKMATIIGCTTKLTEEHWQRAETVMKFFICHRMKLFSMIGGTTTAKEESAEYLQKLVLNTFRKLKDEGKDLTQRNLLRKCSELNKYTGRIDEAIDQMIKAEYIKVIKKPHSNMFEIIDGD